MEVKKTRRKLITSKSVFTVTMVVILLTILSMWLFGLGQHRTIFENSILSTTLLSAGFFLFLTIGLYHGVKLRDNIGKLTDKVSLSAMPDFPQFGDGMDSLDGGDGIGGIILGIFLWIIVSILIAIFLWFFGAVLWAGIVVFVAMLYWIFFRALRLVFKNANRCRGNLTMSAVYGIAYTLLYNFWIYGIILTAHYVIK